LEKTLLEALASKPSATLAELAEAARPQQPQGVFNTLASLAQTGKIQIIESTRSNGRVEFRYALPGRGS